MELSQQQLHQLRPDQQPLLDQRYQEAPVLYSLDRERMPSFLQGIQETLINNIRAKTTVFITGESGAGKEMIAGQLIHEIQETNSDVEIGYLSLGMAIKAARNKDLVDKYAEKYGTQLITRLGVEYDPQDYENASKMMHALIEEFYANESGKSKLVVVETVGYTFPTYDQGSSTIENQMTLARDDAFKDRNVFLIGLIADEAVQDATYKSRNIAAETLSPQKVNQVFTNQGIRRTNLFETEEEVQRFRDTRGTEFARRRGRETLNKNVLDRQLVLNRFGHFSGEVADAIRTTGGILTEDSLNEQNVRKGAHRAYAEYLTQHQWKIQPESHIFIAENAYLQLPFENPYYNSITQGHSLLSMIQ